MSAPVDAPDVIDEIFMRGENPKYESLLDQYDGKMAWTIAAFKPSLTNDKIQFTKLPENMQHLIREPHGFFSIADNVSNENIVSYLFPRVKSTAKRYILSLFGLNEMRHAEAYTFVTETLFPNAVETKKFVRNVLGKPSVQAMINWMKMKSKFENPYTQDFLDLLLTQIFSEGVFFQFPFNVIFYFKHKGLLQGVTAVNDSINWDEDKHIFFAVDMFIDELKERQVSVEDPKIQSLVHKYANESYHLAEAYIRDVIIQDDIPGFTRAANITHLQFIINQRVISLGSKPLFPEVLQSPFPWLKMTNLEGKNNFFELDGSEYAKNNQFSENSLTSNEEFIKMLSPLMDDENDPFTLSV